MLYIRKLLAVCIVGCICVSAHADSLLQHLRGEYVASQPWVMSLRTITIGDDERAVAAEIFVGMPGCSGAFSGIGTSDGQFLKIRPYKSAFPEERQCILTVKLDKTGKTATVSEEHCSDYHGTQCTFTGKLISK